MHKILFVLFFFSSPLFSMHLERADLLMKAASEGAKERVEELLEDQSLTANSRDKLGRLALHCASEKGCRDTVGLLLELNADVHAHVPIDEKSFVKLARHLEQRGHITACRSITALHVAALHGKTDIVGMLLKAGARVNSIGICNRTPLHEAVQQDHVATAWLLLHNQADVTARSIQGFSALHIAAVCASPLMVSLLLEYESSPNAEDHDGATSLHTAALVGRPEVVRLLLARGASPVARTSLGLTPLHSAAAGKNLREIVTQLGEEPHNHETQEKSFEDHIKVIHILRSRGAHVYEHDSLGQTPLHISAFFNNRLLAETFLSDAAYEAISFHAQDAYPIVLCFLFCMKKVFPEGIGFPKEVLLHILASTADMRSLVFKALLYGATPQNYLELIKTRGPKFMSASNLIKTFIELGGGSMGDLCKVSSLIGKTASDVALHEGHHELANELKPETLANTLPSLVSRWVVQKEDNASGEESCKPLI